MFIEFSMVMGVKRFLPIGHQPRLAKNRVSGPERGGLTKRLSATIHENVQLICKGEIVELEVIIQMPSNMFKSEATAEIRQ